MSDTVQIGLIIAFVVIVVLFMFRERLRNFMIKANKDGVEANLDAGQGVSQAGKNKRATVNISGNKQIGNKNRIDVGRTNVNVEKNLQKGNNQEIVVKSPKAKNTKKAGGTKKR